jgi:hypothetical protein
MYRSPADAVTINGAHFDVFVPLDRLPTTGALPINYGFNIWPRAGAPGPGGSPGGNEIIADFAPDNAVLAASVPEASTWVMMTLGAGAIAALMRRRRVKYRFGSLTPRPA